MFSDSVAPRSNDLFDVSDRVQIELTGRDRARFLHSFCTNDIKKLQPGQGCEAFVTNIQGKVLGHIFVFAEADSLWIESVPDSAATLISHWERFVITDDVRFTDRSQDFAEFLLTGTEATGALEQWGVLVRGLPLGNHLSGESSQLSARSVRRVDWFAQPTWLLSIPVAARESAWNLILQAGAVARGHDEFESLRLAAGFPMFGADITDDNLAQEVGRTAQAISFTKGCYLGQEPIARIDAMGHVNRRLVRIELSSGPIPVRGTEIVDRPPPDGRPVGWITSSAWNAASSATRHPIGLAYLRSGFAVAGTKVFVGPIESVVI